MSAVLQGPEGEGQGRGELLLTDFLMGDSPGMEEEWGFHISRHGTENGDAGRT